MQDIEYNAGDPGLTLGQEDPLEKEMVTHSSGDLQRKAFCFDLDSTG